jgi:hypothetical protein
VPLLPRVPFDVFDEDGYDGFPSIGICAAEENFTFTASQGAEVTASMPNSNVSDLMGLGSTNMFNVSPSRSGPHPPTFQETNVFNESSQTFESAKDRAAFGPLSSLRRPLMPGETSDRDLIQRARLEFAPSTVYTTSHSRAMPSNGVTGFCSISTSTSQCYSS